MFLTVYLKQCLPMNFTNELLMCRSSPWYFTTGAQSAQSANRAGALRSRHRQNSGRFSHGFPWHPIFVKGCRPWDFHGNPWDFPKISLRKPLGNLYKPLGNDDIPWFLREMSVVTRASCCGTDFWHLQCRKLILGKCHVAFNVLLLCVPAFSDAC